MPANKTAAPASPTPVSGAAVQRSEHQRDIVNRLRRIEGQVRALAEMVDAGRPCEDIAQQMSAARKANPGVPDADLRAYYDREYGAK